MPVRSSSVNVVSPAKKPGVRLSAMSRIISPSEMLLMDRSPAKRLPLSTFSLLANDKSSDSNAVRSEKIPSGKRTNSPIPDRERVFRRDRPANRLVGSTASS
jgi:hypothetical protein